MVQKVKRKGETGLAYYGLCEKIEEATRQAMEQGLEQGLGQGMGKSILFLLENIGPVPDPLREHILQEKKEDTMKLWLMMAARSKSIEEFREEASL